MRAQWQYINYLEQNVKTADFVKLYEGQLNGGAFAATKGAFVARVELEGLSDAEVTIADVRLDNLKHTQIPLEEFVYVSLGGQDEPRKLYFSLDQPVPLAMNQYDLPAKTIDVGFDGWAFPGSGVAFLWVLEGEMATSRPRGVAPAEG